MRVAFDLDGVLADFAAAYDAIARRLAPRPSAGPPSQRMERRIWREIQSTENFWAALEPIEPGLVAGIHERAIHYGWDVFFVTQRPATAGDTVQRQTQGWLAGQGFPLPAVIVHRGSRGQLAAALELDFLVDDTVEHCVDVLDVSRAKPIFVCREPDAVAETNAERLGIATCRSADEALNVIVQQQPRRTPARFRIGRFRS